MAGYTPRWLTVAEADIRVTTEALIESGSILVVSRHYRDPESVALKKFVTDEVNDTSGERKKNPQIGSADCSTPSPHNDANRGQQAIGLLRRHARAHRLNHRLGHQSRPANRLRFGKQPCLNGVRIPISLSLRSTYKCASLPH